MSRLGRSSRELSPSETLFSALFRTVPPDKPTTGSLVVEFCNSHRCLENDTSSTVEGELGKLGVQFLLGTME